MMVLRIALAVLLTAFLSTAQAQLDSQWIGKWKGSNKSTLDISPGGMRYRYIECDEDGSRCAQVKPLACVWTRDGDALKNNPDGSCRIGESRPKRSREDIIRNFESEAHQLIKENSSLKRTINESRAELNRMKSGVFSVMVLDNWGNVTELVFDGERIFQLNSFGYVESYIRSSR